jgi:PKD repeat protein
MRSIPLLAATTVILLTLGACGDDGGVGPGQNPVAGFAGGPCTANTACTFTDASTDPQGPTTITTRVWNFGDATPEVTGNLTTTTHTYAAAGTFTVRLTVTDADGNSNSTTRDVVVNGGTPVNLPPTASFTSPACTVNVDCAFTSTSTDDSGVPPTAHWLFDDGTQADGLDVVHRYAAAGSFPVTLTVTDAQGLTGTITQNVTVTQPSAQDCITSGTVVTCTLTITARSTVAVTLTSEDCEIGGQRVAVGPTPRRQTLFFNVCNNPGGTSTITNADGTPTVFEAGSIAQIEFHQGTVDPGDPTPVAPAATIEGTGPTWTINVDDGGNPGGAGEPDFTDVILDVQATAAP